MKARLQQAKGFTLIEILVVIAILAILAGAAWEAFGMIENSKLRNVAKNQIALMSAGMNAYRADNADTCPYATGNENSSNILYKALYRDSNGNGEPDKEGGAVLMPYCDTLVPIKNTKDKEQVEGIPCYKVQLSGSGKSKKFAIFDPWGKPYRYRLGYELSDAKGRSGRGVNPDFDIFSLGPDGLGNGLTNDGENKDNVSNVMHWD